MNEEIKVVDRPAPAGKAHSGQKVKVEAEAKIFTFTRAFQ